jgi:hypothetical protein
MTNITEIKRSNGDLIKIRVTLVTFGMYQKDQQGNSFRYDISCTIREKGKRTDIFYHDAKDNEIFAAKMELWNLIKP